MKKLLLLLVLIAKVFSVHLPPSEPSVLSIRLSLCVGRFAMLSNSVSFSEEIIIMFIKSQPDTCQRVWEKLDVVKELGGKMIEGMNY